MITDKKAEELESKGFFRRAAARWAELVKESVTDSSRDEAIAHQKRCLKLTESPTREPNRFYQVYQAASKTEQEMGISRDRKGRLKRKKGQFNENS